MAPHTAGFFAFSSAYDILARPSATDRSDAGSTSNAGHGGDAGTAGVQPIARYGAKDVLLSGWLEGEPVIAGRAAVVQAAVGTGRVILIGFRAQHRAQSLATFRLLFNSILTSKQ